MQTNLSNALPAHALQSFEQIRQLYPLTPEQSAQLLRNGISFQMLEDFMAVADLSVLQICFVCRVAGNAFRAWRDAGMLPDEHAENVLRLAEVYASGYNYFGQAKKMNVWMEAPNRAMGGIPPLSLLCGPAGFRAVLLNLRRLEEFMLC